MTLAEWSRALRQLLPPGRAMQTLLGAKTEDVTLAAGAEFARFDERIDALLRESDPRTTEEMLDEWEAEYGLPDPCVTLPATTAERIGALLARRNRQRGVISAARFIDIAAQAGGSIYLRPIRPILAGTGVVGDGCYNPLDAYVWPVIGTDVRADSVTAQVISCAFLNLAQRHTKAVFYWIQSPFYESFEDPSWLNPMPAGHPHGLVRDATKEQTLSSIFGAPTVPLGQVPGALLASSAGDKALWIDLATFNTAGPPVMFGPAVTWAPDVQVSFAVKVAGLSGTRINFGAGCRWSETGGGYSAVTIWDSGTAMMTLVIVRLGAWGEPVTVLGTAGPYALVSTTMRAVFRAVDQVGGSVQVDLELYDGDAGSPFATCSVLDSDVAAPHGVSGLAAAQVGVDSATPPGGTEQVWLDDLTITEL